jgi:hypothetical protein
VVIDRDQLRRSKAAGVVERGPDLLHGGGDEVVYVVDVLGAETARWRAVDHHLVRDGEDAGRRHGAAVGEDAEARREQRDDRGVLAAHDHVHRREVDRRVHHHQRPRQVREALLQDQLAILARVHALRSIETVIIEI